MVDYYNPDPCISAAILFDLSPYGGGTTIKVYPPIRVRITVAEKNVCFSCPKLKHLGSQWCQEPSRNQKPSWILVATRTLMKIFQKLFLRSASDYTNSGASISEVRNFQYNFLVLNFPQFQKY